MSKDLHNSKYSYHLFYLHFQYYEGQWQNNQQHGYGEYTWDATYNEHFIFLIYNWYKGAWINGKRTGIGKFL